MAPLDEYEKKRDFRSTPEPSGEGAEPMPHAGEPGGEGRFVIQKHDASSLHYDFRIEADGVLKSWAVPKGPSTDPRDKRLAVMTEDHPLDYGGFEGVIPEGQYGAGTVMVWDAGTYENASVDDDGEPISVADAVNAGQVKVRLDGEKLAGGYALVHTGFRSDKDWLLIKEKDDGADARRNPTSTEPDSVASGRSLDEIAAEEGDEGGGDGEGDEGDEDS